MSCIKFVKIGVTTDSLGLNLGDINTIISSKKVFANGYFDVSNDLNDDYHLTFYCHRPQMDVLDYEICVSLSVRHLCPIRSNN